MRRVLVVIALVCAGAAVADEATSPTIHISRANGPIAIDGDLSDSGWQGAVRLDKWYETNVTDNGEPKVKNVGYLTYDSRFLYAAFELFDDPKQIRSPYNDRDHIGGNTDDYAGIILDTRNDKRSAVLLLANARGIQYDAVSDDSTGEDSAPDFFWDAATKITDKGWILEMRVPFSSLRYDNPNPTEWGIMLYRNWPRDRRYQMFTNKLPRGSNCFICNRSPLVGLQGLPGGGHLVTAPYATAREIGETRDGLGTPFVNRPAAGDGGLDVKWTPNADTAIDATLNPDFSQIESDVAVISTNERFAIFLPEKRPFFLEGVELLKTPIQAVYTRTITSPRWGARSTGKSGSNAYTILVTQDRGGGDVILPSPLGSDFAQQKFSSTALIGRFKRNIKKSFVSFLVTTRENTGGSYNRVFGPDFEWRIGDHETITGQVLLSRSATPDRPDLTGEWNGQKLSSHAVDFWWSHQTKTFDFFTEYRDFGDQFRADNGFIPQVGFRSNYAEGGYTFRPKGFFSRIRTFAFGEYDALQNGSMLYRLGTIGFGADGKFRSFTRLRYAYENFLTGGRILPRHLLVYQIQFSVNRVISQLFIDGNAGQDIDFANTRTGRGANFTYGGTLRPTDHLEIGINNALRWLNVPLDGRRDRVFTAQAERLTTRYTFNAKTFVRVILQNERTNRNQDLYTFSVNQHSGSLGTQLLWAYKLNWQTVMYAGYGDLQEAHSINGDLLPSNRQFFVKVSYAFQQ
ncbi:MAG TPA: DUF5916 domain-containing protein [Thermoanaerobaculia bacterium]|jgi:hypothetical protein|nr:DUF5916 domain-containing protein [Thermoanaerobaculia bacterium]